MIRSAFVDEVVMGTFAALASYGTQLDAELAVALLAAHGITAHVRSDNAGGMRPDLGQLHGVQVLVAVSDVAEARAVLEAEANEHG